MAFPSRTEWQALFDNLSKKEKGLFLFLFLTAWVAGTFILIRVDRYHSDRIPTQGGRITEGVVGTPRFINPLLAISDADRDLTRTIYASLLRPDARGELVPQLAEHYSVSEDGLVYSFILREDLEWHDGKPLTTEDVAFTIELAKNPAIRSPKLANWEGVDVEVLSDREIRFVLHRPFAPFLGNATLGIMPKHEWKDISPEAFSLAIRNTQPVGSGPFKVETVIKNEETGIISAYTLRRFKEYKPEPAYLDNIEFKFYSTADDLASALTRGEIDTANMEYERAKAISGVTEIHLPRIVGIFFNQDNSTLLRDLSLRTALNMATDRQHIVNEVAGGYGTPTSLPIPPGSFAYAEDLEETVYDIAGARAILERAGYEDSDGDGILEQVIKKDRTKVSITIATLETPELSRTAELVAHMWREIGIETNIARFELGDFEQTVIRPRDYDVILFGQNMGYDSDPFGFWHARQIRHPGSNIALYANTKVDGYLEEAQASTNQDKRAELYTSFQEEIIKDKPAVILYSPSYLYVIPPTLKGAEFSVLPFPQDRFSGVESWYLQTKSVWNFFGK